jgi:predicted transcriptional regulator of viral defense system
MKIDRLKPLEKIPYFTIEGFKQILNADESRTQQIREMLSRWAKKGHVIRLKKGIYMTRRFYELHRDHASFTPAVSAIILPQSYVSLDYVLQRAGVTSDITYPLTAITPKNTRRIINSLGTFSYRHIKLPLYLGFRQEIFFGIMFNQASVAKALFDTFYLRPLPSGLRTHGIHLAEHLRLNLVELSTDVRLEFEEYIDQSKSSKMTFVLENLRRTVWQH